jgi:DHA2 family multidrug resistance protein
MLNAIRIAAVYTIIFLEMLDTSIANLALNNIAADIQIDVLHGSWIMTSYGIGLVVAFPLGTMLSKHISGEAVLLLGALLFLNTSTACGLATNDTSFLLFRVLQGLGSGMTLVAAQSLFFRLVGEQNRALAISFWSSAISLAPVFGPLISALTIERFSWRWLFLANAPLVAICLMVLVPVLDLKRIRGQAAGAAKFLTLGAFAVAVIASQYIFDFGEQLGWLQDPAIRWALALSGVFAVAFFLINTRPGFQIYDLSVFRDRSYSIATLILSLANALIWASVVLLPIWLRIDYNMPILFAGLVVSAGSAIAALATPFVGKYLPARWFGVAAIASLLFSGVSFLMMSSFSTSSSHEYMVTARLVAGVGLAIMTMPLLAISLTNVTSAAVINANALSMTARTVTANVCVAFAFIAYKHMLLENQAQFTAGMDSLSSAKYSVADARVALDLVNREFSTDALQNIFLAGGVLLLLGALVMLPAASRFSAAQKRAA